MINQFKWMVLCIAGLLVFTPFVQSDATEATNPCAAPSIQADVRPGVDGPPTRVSVGLFPPSDMRIKTGDALIFIAKHFDDCRVAEVAAPKSLVQMPSWHPVASEIRTVLILGWSRMVPKVLAELLSYQRKGLKIDVVGITPIDEREVSIDSVASAQRTEKIRQIEINFMDPDEVAEIHPENYDAEFLAEGSHWKKKTRRFLMAIVLMPL